MNAKATRAESLAKLDEHIGEASDQIAELQEQIKDLSDRLDHMSKVAAGWRQRGGSA